MYLEYLYYIRWQPLINFCLAKQKECMTTFVKSLEFYTETNKHTETSIDPLTGLQNKF